ncbi:hypothetical protein GS531_25100 [Rhodococcus hoagii]|nr:hypothetical protein [Prescottella equi]
MSGLISDPPTWVNVGDALTEVGGDAQLLDERTRAQVQADRPRDSGPLKVRTNRGHVVYCAVSLPHGLPDESRNLPSTCRKAHGSNSIGSR